MCSKRPVVRIRRNVRSERQGYNRPDRAVPGRKAPHHSAHRRVAPLAPTGLSRGISVVRSQRLGATPSPFRQAAEHGRLHDAGTSQRASHTQERGGHPWLRPDEWVRPRVRHQAYGGPRVLRRAAALDRAGAVAVRRVRASWGRQAGGAAARAANGAQPGDRRDGRDPRQAGGQGADREAAQGCTRSVKRPSRPERFITAQPDRLSGRRPSSGTQLPERGADCPPRTADSKQFCLLLFHLSVMYDEHDPRIVRF